MRVYQWCVVCPALQSGKQLCMMLFDFVFVDGHKDNRVAFLLNLAVFAPNFSEHCALVFSIFFAALENVPVVIPVRDKLGFI